MSQKVIDLLNQARSAELGAINQYMIHHYGLEDQDFGKLAAKIKEIAIVEMKHAEKLAERIPFLNGEPTSKPDLSPQKGQTILEILSTNFHLQAKAVKMYYEVVWICAEERDQKSRKLFEELIAGEEGHLNAFENIKGHGERLGDSYIATLIG